MDRLKSHISFLSNVADELGDLKDEVVFVGGSICGLLITDLAGGDVRPTDDVDFIVKVTTYSQYTSIQEKLRKKGFKDVVKEDGPICRMKIGSILVDVLPVNGDFLGFNNKWYERAIETAEERAVKVGDEPKTIRVVNAPLFICTKLDAFKDRGNGDFMASHDIEDIVAVLNGRKELWDECWLMPADVRSYLKKSFSELLHKNAFLDAVPGMLPYGSQGRERIIRRRMSLIANSLLEENFSGQIEFAFDAGLGNAVEVAVISSDAFDDEVNFPTRVLNDKHEVIQLQSELNIDDYNQPWSRQMRRLYSLENTDTQTLARWKLLPPYLAY